MEAASDELAVTVAQAVRAALEDRVVESERRFAAYESALHRPAAASWPYRRRVLADLRRAGLHRD